MQLWHKAGKNFRYASPSFSKRGLKLCYQEEGRLAIASESQIRSNLITTGGIGLIYIGGTAKVQNEGESRHRPIPFSSNPQKWIAMQLQPNDFMVQWKQEYEANKLYRIKKLKEGSSSRKNLGVLMFCPDWDVSRVQSSRKWWVPVLWIKNLYFEIHRLKLSKSSHFQMSWLQHNFLRCSLLHPENCVYFCVCTRTYLCLDIIIAYALVNI